MRILKFTCAIFALATIAFAAERNIDKVQQEQDRGNNRVTDPATHELDEIDSRPRREIERLERDEDRREILERQQRKAERREPAATQPRVDRSIITGMSVDPNPNGAAAGRVALEEEIFEVLERHLPAEQVKNLREQLDADLTKALNRYDVRRLPATQATP